MKNVDYDLRHKELKENELLKEECCYTWCYVKINDMYLKDFMLYNGAVSDKIEFKCSLGTEKNDALLIKISYAQFIAQFIGEGTCLEYV